MIYSKSLLAIALAKSAMAAIPGRTLASPHPHQQQQHEQLSSELRSAKPSVQGGIAGGTLASAHPRQQQQYEQLSSELRSAATNCL